MRRRAPNGGLRPARERRGAQRPGLPAVCRSVRPRCCSQPPRSPGQYRPEPSASRCAPATIPAVLSSPATLDEVVVVPLDAVDSGADTLDGLLEERTKLVDFGPGLRRCEQGERSPCEVAGVSESAVRVVFGNRQGHLHVSAVGVDGRHHLPVEVEIVSSTADSAAVPRRSFRSSWRTRCRMKRRGS